MEESTPLFDALWDKYNETPIFDQVLQQHEHKKYLELAAEYQSEWFNKRVYSIEEFRALMGFPPKEEELMTSKWQDLVNKMRYAMDLPVADGPRQLTSEEAELHIQMIRDEFEKEFVPAARSNDLVEFYDAGIDCIVYILGAMSNAGMDIDPGFEEIMRSNMSKFDGNGRAIRSRGVETDGEPKGKILKGPNYEPPKLGPILNSQSINGHEDTAVYKDLTLPLTLGIGGPKIGEGRLHMEHNGELMFKGMMVDVAILPILDHLGLSVSGVSVGPDEVDVHDEALGAQAFPQTFPVIPKGTKGTKLSLSDEAIDHIEMNDFAYLDHSGKERSTAQDRENWGRGGLFFDVGEDTHTVEIATSFNSSVDYDDVHPNER